MACSLQANYTERPPFVGEILVPTFADRGMSRGQRGQCSRLEPLFFFQVAPHLSS
jgi:hypothetical protein